MGLDVYSGTLTRYFSHNWETLTQQLAQENGQKCVMIDACGNEITTMEDPDEISKIHETVCQWADNIAQGIDSALAIPPWKEASNIEYYSDKPDWEAFGALVLVQACRLLKRPIPEYVEAGWVAYDDPIVKEAMTNVDYNSLICNVSWWLPIKNRGIYTTLLPTGDKAQISTVALLKEELEELNRQMWNADTDTVLSWRNEKYYVPAQQKEPKLFLGFIRRKNIRQREKYRTEDLAQCAFSIMYQAVCFAEAYQVPIILDY